jgi:ketose-bisphosphate aldolase
LRANTDRATKITVPGPFTMSQQAVDEHYGDEARLAMDLAADAAVPVLVHLDHCRDPEVVARALTDGYDSVMFDGSRLELDENIRITTELVARARRRTGVAVEAELGMIGGSEDTDPAAAMRAVTRADDAAAFVSATGIDILAAALGNLHRMPDDSTRLDEDRVRAIADAAGVPLALHGASGIDRGQLPALIAAGVAKVNVSSRVTRALAAGIREAWATDPDALDLRRFLGEGRSHVRDMAAGYFKLLGSEGAGTGEAASAGWSASLDEVE